MGHTNSDHAHPDNFPTDGDIVNILKENEMTDTIKKLDETIARHNLLASPDISKKDMADIIAETWKEVQAALRFAKAMQPRPISEAPRDGTDIIAWGSVKGKRTAKHILYFEEFENRGWLCSRTHKPVTYQPTHFTPLPDQALKEFEEELG